MMEARQISRCLFHVGGEQACLEAPGLFPRSFFHLADVRAGIDGGEAALLTLPISADADKNSRPTGRRSHRSRIKPKSAASNGAIEPADKAAQRRISHRFVPVIEDAFERFFTLEGGQHRTQNRRHPEQHGQAPAEADAAERGENDQDGQPQAEAGDHVNRSLDRFRLARQIQVRKLGQKSPVVWFELAMATAVNTDRRAQCGQSDI
jgi:hypothetical protein